MFNLSKKVLVVIFIISLAVSSTAFESFNLFGKKAVESFFLVDYASFKSEMPEKIHLEIYYQIYNNILNFYKAEDIYEAEYEISIKIYDNDDLLVDSYKHSKKLNVPSKIKTKSKYDYRTNQIDFELDPGKYVIEFILSDPNSTQVINRQLKLNLKSFENKHPRMSDIELVQAAKYSDDKGTRFSKGELTLVPSVSHKFGNTDNLKLLYYLEIYQGFEPAEKVRVETVLRHSEKGMVYRDTLTTDMTENTIKQFREISIDDMLPGDYELIVTLRGRRNKKIAIKFKDFELVWSMKLMLKHDYKSIIGQLAIVAQKSEINELKKYKTYEERLDAINSFWHERDPTPGTKTNEAKQEFYQRVQIANQNFTHLFQQGWKTDRGRIYILFGEPDQVDDYPIVPNRRPYQEWHYYRGSRYRKFVFVDENEDGDYRLRYPYNGLNQRPDF